MTTTQTTKFINLLKGAAQTTSIATEIKRLEESIRLYNLAANKTK